MEGRVKLVVKRRIFGIPRVQGFRFDMRAWKIFASIVDNDIEDANFFVDKTALMKLYYSAAMSYQFDKKRMVDFTEKDVIRWHNNLKQKTAQVLFNTLLESNAGGESVHDAFNRMFKSLDLSDEKQKDEGLKKKSTK